MPVLFFTMIRPCRAAPCSHAVPWRPTPWENYSFSVARAVTRMYAHYDRSVLPFRLRMGSGRLRHIRSSWRQKLHRRRRGWKKRHARDPRLCSVYERKRPGCTGQYSTSICGTPGTPIPATVVNLGDNRLPQLLGLNCPVSGQQFRKNPPRLCTTSQRITVRKGARYTVSFGRRHGTLAPRSGQHRRGPPVEHPPHLHGCRFLSGWTFFSGTFTALIIL